MTHQSVPFKEFDIRNFAAVPSFLKFKLDAPQQALLERPIRTLITQSAHHFGDHSDGVIEFAAQTSDSGVIELGYYYGTGKPKNIVKVSTQIGCPMACTFCATGLLGISRSSLYYREKAVSEVELAIDIDPFLQRRS